MSKSKVKFIFKTNTSQLMMKFISQHLLLRYRRTVLGYLWTLINPLLMMAVLAFVFSTLFKNDIKTFAVFLFLTYPFYLQVFFFTDFELTVIRAVEPWSAAHGNEQKTIGFLCSLTINGDKILFSMSYFCEIFG